MKFKPNMVFLTMLARGVQLCVSRRHVMFNGAIRHDILDFCERELVTLGSVW